MRFGDLTYLEIREGAGSGWLAVVPTGCAEQQGPHLPVDHDTWFVETTCLAAAERARENYGVESLVLPALPFGPTPEHRNYGAGFIDIPAELHDALVRAILDSLADQGFTRILVWRGCGGHDLCGVVRRFNRDRSGVATASLPAHFFHDIWGRVGDPAVPGGHADSFTTAISMHFRPDTV